MVGVAEARQRQARSRCVIAVSSFAMDSALTEEQRSPRRSIIHFARRELSEEVIAQDKSGTFSRDAWTPDRPA